MPLAREAWGCFIGLMRSPENQGRWHGVAAEFGLTPGLLRALVTLPVGAEEGRPMKDLAATWSCDASYVTSLVDGLEERGLVERRPHPSDRRSRVVALTAEGEGARAAVLARLHEPPEGFAALTEDELRTLIVLMRKVTVAAGAAAPEGPPGA